MSRSTPVNESTAPVIVADPGGLRATGTRTVAGPSADLLSKTETSQVVWVGEDLAKEIGVAPAGTAQDADAQIIMRGVMAVANTLMLSVHQRLRELGLRSAMGWTRRRIGALVLTESGVAGLVLVIPWTEILILLGTIVAAMLAAAYVASRRLASRPDLFQR
ncbi:ABC transporter permease [Nocardioides sp.]|uniref:ABC transporter permease n=1 Tax=Nocardioides sp. TaxID=35761 RepID=UPI0039E67FBD